MKVSFLKKYNRVLAYLLSFLGVGGACSFSGCLYGTGGAMYGTPTATFHVHGKVFSEDSVKIPYIRVTMQWDTFYTNADGAYTVDISSYPSDQEFPLHFEDMDGPENGSWQSRDTTVAFVNPRFRNGDGGWYSGETSKEFNVKLKEK